MGAPQDPAWLRAFACIKRETRLPHKLVLSGKRTWIAPQVERLIAELGLKDNVIDHGKTPQAELPLLYAGASALVYASLYESFGMPIVEAMACGTPVLTSNVTAMPETAGDAGVLVDPESCDSIAVAMHRIASDADFALDRSMAGLEHAATFTWDATARASLDANRRVTHPASDFLLQ